MRFSNAVEARDWSALARQTRFENGNAQKRIKRLNFSRNLHHLHQFSRFGMNMKNTQSQ
jgi:hypothetical protein